MWRIVKTGVADAVGGLMILMVLSWFTVFFAVLPLIGIVTGDLYIPGKYNNPGLDIRGTWARVISAALLSFFAWSAWGFLKWCRSYLRQFKSRYGRRGMIVIWSAVALVACLIGLMILGMIVGDNP